MVWLKALTESDEQKQRALERVGSVVQGKWTLLALLGVGGSAAVYAAEHRNGRRAAIKLLHPRYVGHKSAQRRFLQEAYAANRVQHPSVVQVFDDGTDEHGNAFLVSELLEGRSLAEVQEQSTDQRLGPATSTRLVCAALEPLAAAHRKGIVHRDLKPGNLFLCENGSVKLLDFGIARMAEAPISGSQQTATGAWLGTPAFVAPEQARARWSEVDARSDVWAMGATLFTLLTGEFVYRAETLNEQLGLAMTTPARSLASMGSFSPGLVEVVDRALAFEKEERFADAAALLGALSLVVPSLNDNVVPRTSAQQPRASASSATQDPLLRSTLGSTTASASSPAKRGMIAGLSMGGALGLFAFFWSTHSAPPALPIASAPHAQSPAPPRLDPLPSASAETAPPAAPAVAASERALPVATASAPVAVKVRTPSKPRSGPPAASVKPPANLLDIRD